MARCRPDSAGVDTMIKATMTTDMAFNVVYGWVIAHPSFMVEGRVGEGVAAIIDRVSSYSRINKISAAAAAATAAEGWRMDNRTRDAVAVLVEAGY